MTKIPFGPFLYEKRKVLYVIIVLGVLIAAIVGGVLGSKAASQTDGTGAGTKPKTQAGASSGNQRTTRSEEKFSSRNGVVTSEAKMRSIGKGAQFNRGRVKLGDAEALAASFRGTQGGKYRIATEEEAQNNEPAEHRGDWHWAYKNDNRTEFVKIAHYRSSSSSPGWKNLWFNPENQETEADWIYVIKV